MRPEATLCKGDSLCRVLSSEMPHGSAFHLAGAMSNGVLRLSAPINDAITLSKSLQLHGSSLQVHVVDSVNIYVLASLNLRGVAIPFTGKHDVNFSFNSCYLFSYAQPTELIVANTLDFFSLLQSSFFLLKH